MSRLRGPTHKDASSNALDAEMEQLSRGMALLLAARDRTLTLAEQRASAVVSLNLAHDHHIQPYSSH